MLNTLQRRDRYAFHRIKSGSPVTADPAVGSMSSSGAMSTKGWRVVHGFVKLTGGTNPTVKLQQIHAIVYEEDPGTDQSELRYFDEETVALSDGDDFYLAVGEGRILMRIAEVSGSPTKVEVLLSGDSRDPDSLGIDASKQTETTVSEISYSLDLSASGGTALLDIADATHVGVEIEGPTSAQDHDGQLVPRVTNDPSATPKSLGLPVVVFAPATTVAEAFELPDLCLKYLQLYYTRTAGGSGETATIRVKVKRLA